MALTSTDSRADRRANRHRTLIGQAPTGRLRMWAAWRWLLAEAAKQGADQLDQVAAQLAAIAADLNAKAGDRR